MTLYIGNLKTLYNLIQNGTMIIKDAVARKNLTMEEFKEKSLKLFDGMKMCHIVVFTNFNYILS